MPKYPKVLPRRAKQFGVEDDQAKLAWAYTKFMAMRVRSDTDYEFMNQEFETRLRAIGALNALQAQLALMSPVQKYRLVIGS